MIASAKYDTRLTIEVNTPGNELAGENVENWEELREEMFKVIPLSGREYQQSQQMQSNVSHRLICHWFAGANSRMRIVRRAVAPEAEVEEGEIDPPVYERIFNVESVVNVEERNWELEWRCTEVDVNG